MQSDPNWCWVVIFSRFRVACRRPVSPCSDACPSCDALFFRWTDVVSEDDQLEARACKKWPIGKQHTLCHKHSDKVGCFFSPSIPHLKHHLALTCTTTSLNRLYLIVSIVLCFEIVLLIDANLPHLQAPSRQTRPSHRTCLHLFPPLLLFIVILIKPGCSARQPDLSSYPLAKKDVNHDLDVRLHTTGR